MMSLWCMMRAPLIAGGDLPKNDEFTLKLLTNADVLEIEKTTHCGHQLYRTEKEIAWIAPRRDGKGIYVALFNISEKTATVGFALEAYDLEGYSKVKELWSGKESKVKQELRKRVPAHGAAIFYLQ